MRAIVGALEKIGGVLEKSVHPRAMLAEREREIELRGGAARIERRHPQARRGKLCRRIVPVGEHHLKQRIAAQVALALDLVDQPVERQIAMGQRAPALLAHPPEQCAESRIARQIRPQHQRVDEQADGAAGVAVPVGRGKANGNIFLPRIAPQERVESRHENHERRGALSPSERLKALDQRLRDGQRQAPAAKALPRGPRTIGR